MGAAVSCPFLFGAVLEFQDIKGMGKSRIDKLRAAGIYRPLDLLLRFPYKYVDLNAYTEELKNGTEVALCGTVISEPSVRFLRKGLRITSVMLKTEYGEIEAAWFNQKYIKSALTYGKTLYLSGKIKKFGKKISISAPKILHPCGSGVIPVYRSIRGIPHNVFSDAIDMILDNTHIDGYIPEGVRKKYALGSLTDVFREVHRPRTIESAYYALKILSLEKLSYTISMYSLVKSAGVKNKPFVYKSGDGLLNDAIKKLPFALTYGQKTALNEIVESMRGGKPMNRLLQGDVGCGKTIIALLAMYFAYLNGYQSVLMAPTEILAVQHYKSAIKYLENLGAKAVLLSGSMTKSERDAALFNIKTNGADIIIGTHALIGDDVIFNNLSLIITDEQQRFGVNQRGRLENKAVGADTLVMTATPIPRTLALTLYGELEQSVVSMLPSNRADIITAIVPENKFDGMFEYVVSHAEYGEQTYIVCPRIDADDEEDLVSAVELYEKLNKKYKNVIFGLLHGKLKDTEKNSIMGDFASGKINILISTTVIEVGIDVPDAVNIIIFNSERYGLSQLHQLRGRVGRGNKTSYCFLPVKGGIPERLEFFRNCRNGFELSEYDFAQRGAGDFIGTRQHGDTDDLPVKIDAELIKTAKAISDDTLKDGNSAARLRESMTSGAEEYVRSITMN